MAQHIDFPSDRVSNLINRRFGSRLEEVGFGIVDGMLGDDWTSNLRKEIKLLHEKGLLVPNRTYYEGKKDENGKFVYAYSVSKPNVFELDLSTMTPAQRKVSHFIL